MKVPTSLLPHRMMVAPYLGSTGLGETHGTAVEVRCKVEGRRTAVRRPDGTKVTGTAVAMCRPDAPVQLEARATMPNGDELVVLDIQPGEGLTRPAFIDVVLGVQS